MWNLFVENGDFVSWLYFISFVSVRFWHYGLSLCLKIFVTRIFLLLNLTGAIVVSLALICSFTRMRNHLSLGNVKQDDVSEDTVKAVAETLKKSTLLKVSEDGEFYFFIYFFSGAIYSYLC